MLGIYALTANEENVPLYLLAFLALKIADKGFLFASLVWTTFPQP